MIHVDRAKVPPPAWWRGPDFRRFLDAWAQFHGEGGTRAKQRWMVKTADAGDIETWRRRALPALLEGFDGRCAYTEEPIDEKTGTVVFHRPEADAVGSNGEIWPQHYWWLVADWSNWYLASLDVASTKSISFPVVGERSPLPDGPGIPSQTWMKRQRDRGLLLDPCLDFPAWYLDFKEDGSVTAREHPSAHIQRQFEEHSRGAITIKLLGLDRPNLESLRRSSARAVRELFRSSSRMVTDMSQLELLTLHGSSHRGAIRQAVAREILRGVASREVTAIQRWHTNWLELIHLYREDLAAEITKNGVPWSRSPLPIQAWNPLRSVFNREWPELEDEDFRAIVNGHWRPGADEPLTVEAASDLESERVIQRSARIEQLKVRNFKAIEHLELDLSAEPVALLAPFDPSGTAGEEIPTAVRWTALLGENGSGKSCCLQALGLALAADRLNDLLVTNGLEWSRMLRRGATRGRILVRMLGGSRLDLRFNANRHWWIGPDRKKLDETPRMAAYIRGYGATRLLEGGPVDAEDGAAAQVRLANLFDPRAPVVDAEQWLLGLPEGDFNVAALTLSGFLEDDRAAALRSEDPDAPPLMTREGGEVLVSGDRLSYLSDGYRAVITLVCDIMAGLGTGWSKLRNARGIVLIDELGSHLHPRWRMEITGRLRRELPNVQFFVSTHEPLCLRGLFEGEVIRVRKTRPERVGDELPPPGAVVLERVERSPSDYRVDQLLTSEFFGLDTTIDPDLDRRFQAYYRLLAMDPEERAAKGLDERMIELKTDIQRLTQPVLGFTRRDQLVYEAIDDLLADERGKTPEEKQARRKATLLRIQEIWKARSTVGGGSTAGRRESRG